jgi:hypothetical protein
MSTSTTANARYCCNCTWTHACNLLYHASTRTSTSISTGTSTGTNTCLHVGILLQCEDAASSCWGWYCSESLWSTSVFIDDVQKPCELLWFLEMLLASWTCWPQLFHPHVEDDNGHVEDEHPTHPLQGMSPDNIQWHHHSCYQQTTRTNCASCMCKIYMQMWINKYMCAKQCRTTIAQVASIMLLVMIPMIILVLAWGPTRWLGLVLGSTQKTHTTKRDHRRASCATPEDVMV